jgi:hypothetical protein
MMVVRKNVLEYIITLVVVKNKVRLKKCLKFFQIWQSSIPQINLSITSLRLIMDNRRRTLNDIISTIFLLNIGTVPTVWYIFFHFIIRYEKKQLVVVKNKVRLKKCLKKFQIWQSSIPQINLSITSLRLIPKFRPVLDNQCYDFSIEYWNCSDSVIYIFSFYYTLWKKNSWVAIVKKIYGCDRLRN